VNCAASAGEFSVLFGSFQTNYSFSRFLTLSTLIQMNTSNTQAASANIRLRGNYRPDSDLYIIYTAGQRFASLIAENPPQYYENRFVIWAHLRWGRLQEYEVYEDTEKAQALDEYLEANEPALMPS